MSDGAEYCSLEEVLEESGALGLLADVMASW